MSEFTRIQTMAGISQDELDELKQRVMDMAVVKWSEMTPEERDRLVHVEVIGKPLICPGQAVTEWVKSPSRIQGEYFEYATWKCETCGRAESCIAPESHEVPGEIPLYTQDLNAAWLVVEKVCRHSLFASFKVEYTPDKLKVVLTHRDVHDRSLSMSDSLTVETSLAETICLVALLAAGVEVEPYASARDDIIRHLTKESR